jgi:hypothetical protein
VESFDQNVQATALVADFAAVEHLPIPVEVLVPERAVVFVLEKIEARATILEFVARLGTMDVLA